MAARSWLSGGDNPERDPHTVAERRGRMKPIDRWGIVIVVVWLVIIILLIIGITDTASNDVYDPTPAPTQTWREIGCTQ